MIKIALKELYKSKNSLLHTRHKSFISLPLNKKNTYN